MDDSLTVSRVAAPIREQAVRNLREAIVTGRFKQGEHLAERALCELLGTSRTTVREALRQLQTEGFVEMVPGHGPVVATITEQDARDLYEVRETFECASARLFCERADDSDIADLEAALEHLRDAYGSADIPSIIEAKDRLYGVLFWGAGNQVLTGLAEVLYGRIAQQRSASLSRPGRTAESIEEVVIIVKALLARDAAAAEAACIVHVRNAREAALEVLFSDASSHQSE